MAARKGCGEDEEGAGWIGHNAAFHTHAHRLITLSALIDHAPCLVGAIAQDSSMEPLRMNCTASVPLPRIFDTTSERLALVKISATSETELLSMISHVFSTPIQRQVLINVVIHQTQL